MSEDINQLYVDRFYARHGKCCAGCDFWSWHNPVVGDYERMALLGMKGFSRPPEAGHIMTNRRHVCGDFVDTFEWESLLAGYLRDIGMTVKREWQK